jgi:hypothetical protein
VSDTGLGALSVLPTDLLDSMWSALKAPDSAMPAGRRPIDLVLIVDQAELMLERVVASADLQTDPTSG